MAKHHVVIVGGGFGGLYAARSLRRAPVRVTVVDRRNYHVFQPLLYQVVTGGLSPADISSPLRSVLRAQRDTHVVQAEAVDLDAAGRRLILKDGELGYDTLIVAAGGHHHYFGHDEWARRAPGLKTIEDATGMRSRILGAFERAERSTDPDRTRELMTFVIVGAGPTGVELAGAIGEMARHTLARDFRRIHPPDARILLVEGAGRVLPSYPEKLSAAASRSLARLGVEVLTATMVSEVDAHGVVLSRDGHGVREPAATVLWAAGVQASPLARVLRDKAGARLDRADRVIVEPDCSVAGHREILVIGDMARVEQPRGQPLPGVAPVAIQQGQYVSRLVVDRMNGRSTPPFHYRDRGSLAVIGRAAAVAELGRFRFSGYLAWLLWLFVHIMLLVGFENRVLVFVQWAFSYFTRNRGARLITGSGDRDDPV